MLYLVSKISIQHTFTTFVYSLSQIIPDIKVHPRNEAFFYCLQGMEKDEKANLSQFLEVINIVIKENKKLKKGIKISDKHPCYGILKKGSIHALKR